MTKRRRVRSERREAARAAAKLLRDREKLARAEEGGAPDRPCLVPSASLVEPRAKGFVCLSCDSVPQVAAHTAEQHGGRLLRVVRLACSRCGQRRVVYFQIVTSQLN